jgi:hypothetical protein
MNIQEAKEKGYKVLTAKNIEVGQCYISHNEKYVVMGAQGLSEAGNSAFVIHSKAPEYHKPGSRYFMRSSMFCGNLWRECTPEGFAVKPVEVQRTPVRITVYATVDPRFSWKVAADRLCCSIRSEDFASYDMDITHFSIESPEEN